MISTSNNINVNLQIVKIHYKIWFYSVIPFTLWGKDTLPQENFTKEKLEQIQKIVNLPDKYHTYNKKILNKFFDIYQISSKARWKGIDPEIPPESKITIDIA